MYRISILPEPEIFNGKPMYCWCIFKINGDQEYNCGHGWSDSIEKAARDANDYYKNLQTTHKCYVECPNLILRQEEYDDELIGYCGIKNDKYIGTVGEIGCGDCECLGKKGH